MKVIRLKTVHYVSKEGITLTLEKPSIEATEDNVKKLEYFIKEGYLEIVDLDKEKIIEEKQELEIPETEDKSEKPVAEAVKENIKEDEKSVEETEEKEEKKSKKSKK